MAIDSSIDQAIQAVIGVLTEGRSCIIMVLNNTDLTLSLTGTTDEHGGFAQTPQASIPPQGYDVFSVQSADHSLLTGVEGTATYSGDNDVSLTIHWDNPYLGGNSADATLFGENQDQYRCEATAGNGDCGAQMRFTLLPAG